MPLRILHVLRPADSDAGRSAEAVCSLAVAQGAFGHTVEIATVGGYQGGGLGRIGVPLHVVPSGWGPMGYSRDFVRWMKGRAGAYDCVIAHGIWDSCSLGTWEALRDASIPYFVFTHGMLAPWFKLHRPFQHLIQWLYWPWAGYPVLRDAHAVFFMSEEERHRAREAFWLYDCHEFAVRSGAAGIPAGRSPAADALFLEGQPDLAGKRLFTFFADHRPIEGFTSAARAVAELSRKGLWKPEAMRLVVTGWRDEAALGALRRAASRSGVEASLAWVDTGEGDAQWALLRSTEALLRPSSHEVCATRVANALSAGTPVLMSTGVLCWKDVVNDGAGYADEDTPEGWSRLLRRAISLGDADRAALRLKARRCFEERFTLVGAAHTLTSSIYLLLGVHRDSRWDLRPLRPASELA